MEDAVNKWTLPYLAAALMVVTMALPALALNSLSEPPPPQLPPPLELEPLAIISPLIPGDCNGDARVDYFDYQALEANFGKPGTIWQGDFDGSGFVDFADYMVLEANFGRGLEPPSQLIAELPEPLTLSAVLLAVGSLAGYARRRMAN